MNRSALIITSTNHCVTAQETLRVQDTVSALRRAGWVVDVLTPSANPILSATLEPDVRVSIVPRVPFMKRVLMFLRGFSLASKRRYSVLHGFDDGADVARAVGRTALRKFAYIAEIHHPENVRCRTVAHAAAVIVPREGVLTEFRSPPPMARVSVLPEPHAELADNAFTAAEFTSALDGIYTYVLRKHPEIDE